MVAFGFSSRVIVMVVFLCSVGIAFSFAGARNAPNVILISLDTLRADHLSCYGYKEIKTPFIDSLAAEGILFERAYSHATYTLPSHVSLFTSLLPWEHQIFDVTTRVPLSQFPLTLAESYQKAGYTTVGFTGGGLVESDYGFNKGFDAYEVAGYPDEAIRWIKEEAVPKSSSEKKPFFLFLHTYETSKLFTLRSQLHYECSCGEKFIQTLPVLYDISVSSVDAHTGKILEALKTAGLEDSTIVVVTSDHGESFCEKHNDGLVDAYTHNIPPYQEQIHVPLIIRIPPGLDPHIKLSRRINDVVGLIDIAPTLLELSGIEVPKQFHGTSLVPLLRAGKLEDRPMFAENIAYDVQVLSILYRNKKYIFYPATKAEEYYDLDADPFERKNIANTGGKVVLNLRALLVNSAKKDGWRRLRYREKDKSPIDTDAIQHLKSLGYLK